VLFWITGFDESQFLLDVLDSIIFNDDALRKMAKRLFYKGSLNDFSQASRLCSALFWLSVNNRCTSILELRLF
jgi:hypothetical protein